MSDLPEYLRLRLSPVVKGLTTRNGTRPAAVLIPLYNFGHSWQILYTRRTETVEDHRGQVSFPGGVIDLEDESPRATALREAEEELGIHATDVDVLGALEPHPTVTNFTILPIVGTIPWPYPLRLNRMEVAVAFGVPIEWLANPSNLEIRHWKPQDGRPELAVHFFKPFQGEVIWGATARITIHLLELLENLEDS